jgi:two-component system chemotaxis response regulator CheY
MIINTSASNRILVAEDDAVIMRMVTAIVEKEGYMVVPAHDGRQAIRILNADVDFAAAIFDMHMPHLKGLDIISHMQTERRLKRIPVMMMTSEQDLKIRSRFFAEGAALFIQKPFLPGQLQIMLRLLVGKAAVLGNKQANPSKAIGAVGIKRALDAHC